MTSPHALTLLPLLIALASPLGAPEASTPRTLRTDAALRDGPRAVTIAQALVDREPTLDHVETLAMALAEAGRFDDAVTWQQRAIEHAAAAGGPSAASRRRLDLYQSRRPEREPSNELRVAQSRSRMPPP